MRITLPHFLDSQTSNRPAKLGITTDGEPFIEHQDFHPFDIPAVHYHRNTLAGEPIIRHARTKRGGNYRGGQEEMKERGGGGGLYPR